MEQSFYKDKLLAKGIEVFTPDETDHMFINNSIFNEMAKGIFSQATKEEYLNILNKNDRTGSRRHHFRLYRNPTSY
jgi:aspartate racemase